MIGGFTQTSYTIYLSGVDGFNNQIGEPDVTTLDAFLVPVNDVVVGTDPYSSKIPANVRGKLGWWEDNEG